MAKYTFIQADGNLDAYIACCQIRFDVKEKEDEVLVGLTQKTGRGDETADKKTTIGFTLMKVCIFIK